MDVSIENDTGACILKAMIKPHDVYLAGKE